MLRIQSTRLGQQLQPVWKQSLFAIRHESTASTPSTEPVKETKARSSLSQRLGGSGRGKLMESSGEGKDAFASFLVQAQKNQQRSRSRNNNNNNRQQREAKPGQFDDATEGKPSTGGKRSDNNNNNRQRKQKQQQASGNNNNNNNKRQGGQQRDRKPRQESKKSTSYGSTSTSGPTRRATTFIDKDIDWASLSPVESTLPEVGTEVGVDVVNKEQLEKELNTGDYAGFLSMGESIQWPGTLNRQGLESLVGGNASYGLDQKMTFLATVAKATNIGGAVTAKK